MIAASEAIVACHRCRPLTNTTDKHGLTGITRTKTMMHIPVALSIVANARADSRAEAYGSAPARTRSRRVRRWRRGKADALQMQ